MAWRLRGIYAEDTAALSELGVRLSGGPGTALTIASQSPTITALLVRTEAIGRIIASLGALETLQSIAEQLRLEQMAFGMVRDLVDEEAEEREGEERMIEDID